MIYSLLIYYSITKSDRVINTFKYSLNVHYKISVIKIYFNKKIINNAKFSSRFSNCLNIDRI